MADPNALDTDRAAAPSKPGLSTDARWTVTTGMGIAALLVTLIGMMMQQNATINARIGDTHGRIDQLRTDMRELRSGMQTEMAELRSGMQTEMRELRSGMQTEMAELRSEMRTEMRELRSEMQTMQADNREMRNLLLQVLERVAPAE